MAFSSGKPKGGERKGAKGMYCDYTREHFDFHRRFFQTSPEAAKLAIREAVPALEKAFNAASLKGVAGVKDRLPALRASFWDWLRESNESFRLGLEL